MNGGARLMEIVWAVQVVVIGGQLVYWLLLRDESNEIEEATWDACLCISKQK